MMLGDHYIASAPHTVKFAGFLSDTRRLQAMGWQISAEQDYARGVRLVLKNEDCDLIAITDSCALYHWQNSIVNRMMPDASLLTFNVVRMGQIRNMIVQHSEMENPFASMAPIDAKLQFMPINWRMTALEELVPFAPTMAESRELIVDPDRVGEIMAKLLEAQKPEQEAIRERRRLRESREGLEVGAEPRRQFHAQIISIAA